VNELFEGELRRDLAGFLLGVAFYFLLKRRCCGFTEMVILVGK